MVNTRKTQVFERQMTKLLDGLIDGNIARFDLLQ
jgi:hypothetical protein